MDSTRGAEHDEVTSEAVMVRTVVSLDEKDKRWLDERAAAEGVPMT